MLNEQEKAKLQGMISDTLEEFLNTVTRASAEFNARQSAVELSYYFEDIGVHVNTITQQVGLLGYQEMLEDGYSPLQEDNDVPA